MHKNVRSNDRIDIGNVISESGDTFTVMQGASREYNIPKSAVEGFDGSELYQRDDDRPETVKRRIDVYFEQTSPLISYYRDHDKLVEIDGMQSIDEVTQDLMAALTSN